MKFQHIALAWLATLASIVPAWADAPEPGAPPAPGTPGSPSAPATPEPRNKLETWYLNLGLSYVRNGYGKDADTAVTAYKSSSSSLTSASLALGLDLGVYFRITDTIALGVTDNALADVYASTGLSSSLTSTSRTLSIGQGFIGPSAMFYLTGEAIGSGFFVRTDAGLSYFQVSAESTTGGTSVEAEDTEYGYGFQGGVGYGLPVSSGTRILMNALYSYRATSSYSAGSLTIGASFLF